MSLVRPVVPETTREYLMTDTATASDAELITKLMGPVLVKEWNGKEWISYTENTPQFQREDFLKRLVSSGITKFRILDPESLATLLTLEIKTES